MLTQSDILEASTRPGLWLVAPGDLQAIWPGVLRVLHSTPDRGALADWEDYELFGALIANQNHHLVVGCHNGLVEAVMIIRFQKSPTDITLWIESGNGPIRKYLPSLEKIERWAFALGVTDIKIVGSKGLAHLMGKKGYSITEYVVSKPIRKLWSN